MYEHILDSKLLTGVSAVLLTLIASFLVGRPRIWWRSLMFNFTPAIACAFFVIAPFSTADVPALDLLGGFLFEFTILLLYCLFLKQLLVAVHKMEVGETGRLLLLSLGLQIAFAAPISTFEGFGIFSEGSRIEYLYDNPAAKYLTYAVLLIANLQAGLLASRISRKRAPGTLGYIVLATNFTLSLVSGSKGGFFLWLLAILALVDYRAVRFKVHLVVAALTVVGTAFVITVNVVSDFFGIPPLDLVNVAFNRFFLTNDARALAFDLRSSPAADASFLSESFRSLSTLLGAAPVNPPLGIYLFEESSGVSTGSGANASLLALIVFYTLTGYVMLPAIIAILSTVLLYLLFSRVRKLMNQASSALCITVCGLSLLLLVSQDFLAFQVMAFLVCAAVPLIFLRDFLNATNSRARSRKLFERASTLKHHHPGT